MSAPAKKPGLTPVQMPVSPSRSRLWKLLRPAWWLGRLRQTIESRLHWRKVLFFVSTPGDRLSIRGKMELVSVSDFSQLLSQPDFPWTKATWEVRSQSGHQLFALRENAEQVAFAWLSSPGELDIHELGGKWGTSEPARWIWDCVTPEAHRGKGFYSTLLAEIAQRYKSEKLVIYCNAHNEPSRRGILRANFTPLATVTHSKLGKRCQYVSSAGIRLSPPSP